MKEKLLKITGLEQKSPYIRDFFFAANIRSSIYMSVVIASLEIWMILRLLYRQLNGIDLRTGDYYVSHYLNYSLLLLSALSMFFYALRFIRGKKCSKPLGYFLKWVFMIICLSFGIEISAADYSKGEQVFTFLTMELFAACLLTWSPIVGFLIITVSYGMFYMVIDTTLIAVSSSVGATPATQINMFIMWIATLFCSFANYRRTMSQARKDEALENANSSLHNISEKDELTGIPNMMYFKKLCEERLNSGERDPELKLLFIDIENFRSFNETYGFAKGNELLKKTAHLIEQRFSGSVCARFSDDHFVVLTTNTGYDRVISSISDEIRTDRGDVEIRLKCGAYRPRPDDTDAAIACDRARFACSSIKKHYNDICREYDKALEDKFRLRQYIVNNLESAIENENIRVYYQPVISTENSRIIGYEALARWNDDNFGMLSPAVFIAVLEEHRQIHILDRYIIDCVCKDISAEREMGNDCLPVSVNLSRLDFEMCDIVGYICDTLEKYELTKEYLDIEITESALSENSETLTGSLAKLRELGFRIWLDDFGSGYSSLNVLKDHRFDVVKIDMKFLEGLGENANAKLILENIVSLSEQLNMIPLTEGVETAEQYEFLRKIGCKRVQGYLFSKPVPKSEIRKKIRSGELIVSSKQ